jgi:hypothetical protein
MLRSWHPRHQRAGRQIRGGHPTRRARNRPSATSNQTAASSAIGRRHVPNRLYTGRLTRRRTARILRGQQPGQRYDRRCEPGRKAGSSSEPSLPLSRVDAVVSARRCGRLPRTRREYLRCRRPHPRSAQVMRKRQLASRGTRRPSQAGVCRSSSEMPARRALRYGGGDEAVAFFSSSPRCRRSSGRARWPRSKRAWTTGTTPWTPAAPSPCRRPTS